MVPAIRFVSVSPAIPILMNKTAANVWQERQQQSGPDSEEKQTTQPLRLYTARPRLSGVKNPWSERADNQPKSANSCNQLKVLE